MDNSIEDKIINEILRRDPKLTRKDIESILSRKMSELGISRKTALYILCMEYGVKLTSGITDHIEIVKLRDGLSRIRVVGRILWLREEEYYESPAIGRKPYVRGGIGDNTGTANIIFWGYTRSMLEEIGVYPGAIIDISGAYTKRSLTGIPEIHVSENSDIKVSAEGEFPLLKDFLVRVDKADFSKQYLNVYGKVLTSLNIREYELPGKRGKVGSFLLGAEDRAIRVVLWNKAVEEYNWIKPADSIAIFHGRVKQGLRGDYEVHIGRYSHIELLPGERITIKCSEATISELELGHNLKTLVVRVIAKGKTRTSSITGNKSIGFYVIDETGDATLIFVGDKQVELASNINIGDILMISNFRVAKRGDNVFIFCGDASEIKVNPSIRREIPELTVPIKKAADFSISDKVVTVNGKVVKEPELTIPATGTLKDVYEFLIEDEDGAPITISYRGPLSQYSDEELKFGDKISIIAAILDPSSLLYPSMTPVVRLRAFSRILKIA